MTRSELVELFASKSVTFVPSRYDTLNLVALESLFSGCPTAIGSGAGVCRFLEESFPEVPFIKIDVNNIYESLSEIDAVLNNYDQYRQNLVDQISSSTFTANDPMLGEIYQDSVDFNTEIREELNQWYSQLFTYWASNQSGFSLGKIPGIKTVKTQVKSKN